jgi:hypothetical protein
MISLEILRRDQYQKVAAWNYQDISDVDWDAYTALMERPNLINYGVYLGELLCGYIGIERFGTTVRFHVAKAPRSLHPFALADLLITMARYLFDQGVTELDAIAPPQYRPSRRLAIRTGMTYRETVAEGDRFSITRQEYMEKYGLSKTASFAF